jgi:putative transcriptional regulator
MRFIETPVFTKAINALLDADEYQALQMSLLFCAELGAVIRQSGGLRKMRWSRSGTGKRGGIRVIYYWDVASETFYMLYAYPKSARDDLTPQTSPHACESGARGVPMKKKDFDALTASIKQAGKIRRGDAQPTRVTEFPAMDVKAIRQQIGKSQSEFARMIGVSVATLQNWEQGRRRPEGPARALLKVAAHDPVAVEAALAN